MVRELSSNPTATARAPNGKDLKDRTMTVNEVRPRTDNREFDSDPHPEISSLNEGTGEYSGALRYNMKK
jgi:hypothetical protein